MTKVIMNIDPLSGVILFECINHSDDYDTCTIISTLANVLVELARKAGYEPEKYEAGHVKIDMPYNGIVAWAYEAVFEVIREVEQQNPDHIRIY